MIELLLKCRINANFVRNHRLIQLSASHHNFPVHRKSNETKYHWTSWFFFLSISTFQKTTHFFLFTNKQLSITPPISFNPVFLCFPLPISIRFTFFFILSQLWVEFWREILCTCLHSILPFDWYGVCINSFSLFLF